MALPTTVTQFQRPGARGLVANAETRNLFALTLAIGAVAVLFGVPVYRGATDNLCTGDNTVGDFLGLSRRSAVLDPLNATVDAYAPGDEVPIMSEGVMWVETADAVVAGVPANYDKVAHLWTDAAVAGNVIAVPGVEFDTATTAAGLAKVRVLRTIPA
jgi:hypothetical protein